MRVQLGWQRRALICWTPDTTRAATRAGTHAPSGCRAHGKESHPKRLRPLRACTGLSVRTLASYQALSRLSLRWAPYQQRSGEFHA